MNSNPIQATEMFEDIMDNLEYLSQKELFELDDKIHEEKIRRYDCQY